MSAPMLLRERPRYPELTRMPVGAIASWAFAFAFGMVFWTVLFYAATVIMQHI